MIKCTAAYDTMAELTASMIRTVETPMVSILQIINRFGPGGVGRGILSHPDVHLFVHMEGITHGFIVEVHLQLNKVPTEVVPSQTLNFLKSNDPTWYADVHAPVYATVFSSRTMQSMLAKIES